MSWDTFTNSYPTARKEHKCGICERMIEPGERYRRIDGIYEGDATTLKECLQCELVSDWYAFTYCDLDDAFGPDEINDSLRDFGIRGRALASAFSNKWVGEDGHRLSPDVVKAQLAMMKEDDQ